MEDMGCLTSFQIPVKNGATQTRTVEALIIRRAASSDWGAVSPVPGAVGRDSSVAISRTLTRDSSMAHLKTVLLSARAVGLLYLQDRNSASPAEKRWRPLLSVQTAENRSRPGQDSARSAVLLQENDLLQTCRNLYN